MASYPKRQTEPEEPEPSPKEELNPGTPLIVCPKEDHDREDWLRLSALSLEEAYGEEEPEYSLDMIKEHNPEYEGR